MRRSRRGRLLALAAAIAGTAALAGCSSSTGITAPPLQASISDTFAHLYVLDQADQGNPRPAIRSLHAHAACTKGSPAQPQSGASADWVCDITFLVAGPSTPVTAIYNVNVQTDGCYAGDGDGPASLNGSRTVTGRGFAQVLNPLWLIDGCFDTG